jgi:hypothetical protein
MAHYEDLVIDKGSDVYLEIHLGNMDNSRKNLAGYSVSGKMALTYDAIDSDKISFTAAVLSPANMGIINLSLDNTVTNTLNTKRRYVYDVEISHEDSASNTIIERVLEGLITVSPSVT